MSKTTQQYDEAVALCRTMYEKKTGDYGPTWRLMRPSTLTDYLFIKAKRMREIETSGINMVGEDQKGDFMAIVNYAVMALIQLQLGFTDQTNDISKEQALALYDENIDHARQILTAKNHDYDEAWRDMRISSFTDIILNKICRNKQIETNGGQTAVSEGVEGNYVDMINYALFGIIRLSETQR
ncbi:MAG: DUF1599 domain-containing protein [Paludibacteraceae bacterium]|nr:DUF1599 domain-containing protein [Paludibacteraceae bacterium]